MSLSLLFSLISLTLAAEPAAQELDALGRATQTLPWLVGPQDCMLASAVMAARHLEAPLLEPEWLEILAARSDWERDYDQGWTFRDLRELMASWGLESRLTLGESLKTLRRGVLRGELVIVGGRWKKKDSLHAILLAGYDPARGRWWIQDSRDREARWITPQRLKAFRARGEERQPALRIEAELISASPRWAPLHVEALPLQPPRGKPSLIQTGSAPKPGGGCQTGAGESPTQLLVLVLLLIRGRSRCRTGALGSHTGSPGRRRPPSRPSPSALRGTW